MQEYHKIETLFARDMEGTKKLIPGQFRNETVEFLKDLEWEWTEKIDGTNIRIYWDGHSVTFGGRTDKAQIPAPLVNKLNAYFGGEVNAQLFEETFGEKEAILFGEGYGAKIQKGGGNYIPDGVDFAMFDVMISGNYQPRSTVEVMATMFRTKCVPIVGTGNIDSAVSFIKKHPHSAMYGAENHEMEGIVCRPKTELRDRCGNRVIVKIKWEDFKDLV